MISNNSKRTLKEYVQVFDNIMTEHVCELVINEYKKFDVLDILDNIKIKELVDCSIHRILMKLCKENDVYGFDFVQTITQGSECKLIKQDTLCTNKQSLQYSQSIKKSPESLYCSIQLNDDYEGGEFSIFNGEFLVRPKLGSVLVFPFNYMFPFEIMPVLKRSKYSIITLLK